jgi:hypothetical protein
MFACFTKSAGGGKTRFSCRTVSMLDMRSPLLLAQYKHQINDV